MRINQLVATGSGLSRRAADEAIAAGRVTVDGRIATLGETATERDTVRLDGQPLHPPTATTYIKLHKPIGYISSRARQGTSPTLYELLPPNLQNLRLSGRLDRDSSGLVLLSNDGGFINRYTHPSFNKIKIYELTLDRPLTQSGQLKLNDGVQLSDGLSHVTVRRATGRHIVVSLTEGRNRQLRRTFGALGYRVDRLHRTHIGPYMLGDLAAGSWQEVTPQ